MFGYHVHGWRHCMSLSSRKAARVNACHWRAEEKGFVNINARGGIQNTACEVLHILLPYAEEKERKEKKNCRTFPVFHLDEPASARGAPTNRPHNSSHCTSLPSCIYLASSLHWQCGLRSLQLQRGSKFVFWNTKLRCLPTNKLALAVTPNRRGRRKKKKRKKKKEEDLNVSW